MNEYSIQKNDITIVEKVKIADRFGTRLIGLSRSKSLDTDEGLLICPCKQVHTFGMHFDIDVVFLSKQFQVVNIIHDMKPRQISEHVKNAHSVLELAAGSAKKNGIGLFDILSIEKTCEIANS